MEFVLIPAGKFLMGSPDTEPGLSERCDELPQHRVRISKPFYMGKYTMTQVQWQAVMGKASSDFEGDGNLPVERTMWEDCEEFCRKLSAKVGKLVRLPTEAEWEYACRAGSTGRFCYGDDDSGLDAYAWYRGNADRDRPTPRPVGQKKPNAWGLYDMHGNVWELCADWYGPYRSRSQTDPRRVRITDSRVVRGGTYLASPSMCRCAGRNQYNLDWRGCGFGFRVVAEAQ